MLSLAKIVKHSENCQAIDLIFFLLSSQHKNIVNLHDHMLCIFTPINFTRSQQLIRIKQEDHIQSMTTASLVFFIARSCQHKTNKIGITILSLFQLKLCNLQYRNHLKSIYLATFYSLEKSQKQCISYFYQILHFKMKLTKFGSPKLDTPSLRYEFLKHVFKSVKTNKKIKDTQTDRWGPRSTGTHSSAI